MKKQFTTAIALTLATSLTFFTPLSVYAEEYYGVYDNNMTFATGVSYAMNSYEYWLDKSAGDADDILMDKGAIDELNAAILNEKAAMMYDLEYMPMRYNARTLKESLSNEAFSDRNYYIDGNLIDTNAYFNNMKQAILTTGYEDEERELMYGITVCRTELKVWPTDDIVGYSADDPDDEFMNAALCINEPFIVKQKCTIGDKTFYWGYSDFCSGWVNADCIAICNYKSEWVNSWKCDFDSNDFVVVTQDKIFLEKSKSEQFASNLELTMGTRLKLVDSRLLPGNLSERITWNNYVVYIPTRDADGNYVQKMALIPAHYSVNVGYPDMTKRNLLKISLSALGNRYGWGGMLGAFDCSLYTRDIYRCFGFNIPRNTTWQQKIPGKATDLSGMTSEEKANYINSLTCGTMLYIPGHVFIYLGSVNNIPYVISASGSLVDSVSADDNLEVLNTNTVIINPITVRRKNGTTWLDNTSTAVCLK